VVGVVLSRLLGAEALISFVEIGVFFVIFAVVLTDHIERLH
jgi:hypothetical protein